MPIDMPVPFIPPRAEVMEMVWQAATRHKVHPVVLDAIIATEGGKVGEVNCNNNRNATCDFGLAQINSVNSPAIKSALGISEQELIWSAQHNISAAAYYLNKVTFDDQANGDVWIGAGRYHHKSRKVSKVYRSRVYQHFADSVAEWTLFIGAKELEAER